jgi:hypothetical protein
MEGKPRMARKVRLTSLAVVGVVVTAVLTAAPVSATAQGWLGDCYDTVGIHYAGGWCDGTGPDYGYMGWAVCSVSGLHHGEIRWAGDRRGSYVDCPGMERVTSGGVTGSACDHRRGAAGLWDARQPHSPVLSHVELYFFEGRSVAGRGGELLDVTGGSRPSRW